MMGGGEVWRGSRKQAPAGVTNKLRAYILNCKEEAEGANLGGQEASSNKATPPKPTQKVPPTRDQVFNHLKVPWRTLSFKPSQAPIIAFHMQLMLSKSPSDAEASGMRTKIWDSDQLAQDSFLG